ncbi:MAG: ABC transporter ATP-binding protein [Chloroflexota bacterium]
MRIQVSDVSVDIEDTRIVSDVTLRVEDGEMVGLLGPNGCGKSTLLRAIYRALKPAGGTVLIDERNIWRDLSARESAQRTAVVAQERSADFDFSVLEVVATGRTPHKKMFERDNATDRQIIADSLARVGMHDRAGRIFASLSGGEKQRVLVARALVQQTSVLILDEPTNHLDVRYQIEILDLVRSLGLTTITALHDLNHAAAYCDQLYLMESGSIVTSGSPKEVLTPEQIEATYGVCAEVEVRPSTGHLHIIFTGVAKSSHI